MAVSIFFCYAHEDELFLNKLKAYLSPLQRQGLIDVWHDRDISAGTEWEQEISKHLNEAKIILLLVSPDFINSDYCYGVEMKRALERHERKEALVIPVILRPIYWQGVLGNIQALPTDAKPVVDRSWHTLDEALYDVAEGIRTVVVQLGSKPFFASLKPEAVSLLRTLTGHTAAVHSVAFSPDGQLLASGSHDKTIKIWDMTTGRVLRTLTGHTAAVWSVAFSPDGQTVASGSGDKTIKPSNLESDQALYTYNPTQYPSLFDNYVPDNYVPIEAEAFHETIKLWYVATGKDLRTLTGHTAAIYSVAFSPDGQLLASGSADEWTKLWDVATGRDLHTSMVHTAAIYSVAFSPDGQTLASGSHDKTAEGVDKTIKLWDVATGRHLHTLTEHRYDVYSVAFSPNSQALASGSFDRTIKLWHVTTGRVLRTLTGHTAAVHSVAFSPDGQTLASGSADKTIKIWDMTTGRVLRTLTGHTDGVLSVAFSPDGQTLASGSADKTIKIWGKQ